MKRETLLSQMMGLTWVLLLAVACSAPHPPSAPAATDAAGTSIVIDTDMGLDDVMAILYLLQRPDVTVRAITVTGTGLVHCEAGTRHALGLVALAGARDIPVACGREKPLQGNHHFPPDWREGADSSMGITWPEGGAVSTQTAVELLASVIKSSPQRVMLVTLGPLTNVAEAFQDDPGLVDNLEMITIMGGAVDVPGNVEGVPLSAPNHTAEFNIFVDPHAANIVLKSGAPITLVPLDATNQVPITRVFYKALRDNRVSPAAATVFDLFKANPFIYQTGTYFWWDPLAAAVATEESLVTFETRRLSVVEEEGEEIGRTKVTGDGTQVRVAVAADAPRFEEIFLSTLNGGKEVAIARPAPNTTPTPNMTVTFTGEKCSYDGPQQVPAGEIVVDWIVDNEDHDRYGLAIVTLGEGKTFADLDAWPSIDQPPWLQLVDFSDVGPGSRSLMVADVEQGPIYFVCFTAYPETKMGTLGPVEVEE